MSLGFPVRGSRIYVNDMPAVDETGNMVKDKRFVKGREFANNNGNLHRSIPPANSEIDYQDDPDLNRKLMR